MASCIHVGCTYRSDDIIGHDYFRMQHAFGVVVHLHIRLDKLFDVGVASQGDEQRI